MTSRLPKPFRWRIFEQIEAVMKRIVTEKRPFVRCDLSTEEGLARTEGDKYKRDNAGTRHRTRR